MSKYNDQYYFIFNDYGNSSYLTPFQETEDRNWTYQKLSRTGGPAFFENTDKGMYKKSRKKQSINDVMVAAGDFLIDRRIYELLQLFDIDNLQFYPAVFVDDDENWHEQYMLLNFFGSLDCLDIDKSEIYFDEDDEDVDEDEDEDEDDIEYSVDRFYLCEAVLDSIAQEQRLIFRLAKACPSYTLVHQQVKDIFDQANATGINFIKVSEFISGGEYD